jgi:hypothetical protein
MRAGRRQLFIYWRVAAADATAARQAMIALQRRLGEQRPALHCGLFERADAAGVESTLLETYALHAGPDSSGIDAELQQHIEQAGAEALQPWLRSARHVEVFDACD